MNVLHESGFVLASSSKATNFKSLLSRVMFASTSGIAVHLWLNLRQSAFIHLLINGHLDSEYCNWDCDCLCFVGSWRRASTALPAPCGVITQTASSSRSMVETRLQPSIHWKGRCSLSKVKITENIQTVTNQKTSQKNSSYVLKIKIKLQSCIEIEFYDMATFKKKPHSFKFISI